MSDQSQTETEVEAPTGGAVQRARADWAAGREWKARDRLVGHLGEHADPEALELLGEVYFAMRDLPSAGAAWFGTARRGEDVDAAVVAWRERHADDFGQMWRSLPRSVRAGEDNVRVAALRRRAEQTARTDAGGSSAGLAGTTGARRPEAVPVPRPQDGLDAAVIIAGALGVLFVVCAVVGFVTVLRWVMPG